MEIEGDHYRLVGRVDLPLPDQPGSRVFADTVDFFLDTERLIATGNVTFTSADGRISAERIEFNLRDGTATFFDAAGIMTLPDANRAEFANQDPDVYFFGNRIDKRGPRKYVITQGGFSTCVQPTPRWELTSGSVTINLDEFALARGTVLRVKGVPLFYLPVIYFPLHEDQRSTGFLLPTYGTSTLRGSSLSNAFFWALGRSQDMTFFHDWFTRTGTGEGTEYRYVSGIGSSGLFRFYRLNQHETFYERDGIITALPAQTTYQANGAVNQNLGRHLRAQGNVEYFSDVATQQLYQQNAYMRTMSRRFVSGGLTGIYGPATVGGYYSRSEQFSDTRNSTLFGSTPRATLSIAPTKLFGSPAYASLASEYIFQPNQRLRDGIAISDDSLGRFDIAPALRVPLSRLTYLSVTTNALYRRTYFSRSLDALRRLTDEPLTRQYIALQADVVGPVFSKIWDTPGSTFSDRMKHLIEPSLNVEYITDIPNQARVPVSDSTVVAVGGAMKLTYGITNRFVARSPAKGEVRGSTTEFITIRVQQTYYTDPQTSRYDTSYVSYSGRPKPVDLSPIAVTGRVAPTTALDVNGRMEYDVTGNGLQVVTAGSTIYTGPASISLNYSRQKFTPTAPVSSYLSTYSAWRLKQGRMSAFYGLNWDIDAGYIYSQTLGATYLAQCCGLQADYQVVNFPITVGPISRDRRINFSFILAGLGTFSNFFGLFGGQP